MQDDHETGMFFAAFDADLEHFFSTDTIFCDACYDEFATLWPRVHEENINEGLGASISHDAFYARSRMKGGYSKAEYDDYTRSMECPRCGNLIGPSMRLCLLPPSVDASFEQTIKEMAELARRTPFLLLSHPFAQKVHATLRELGAALEPVQIQGGLWRGREGVSESDAGLLASYDRPPEDRVQEGRYNHAGSPVLYLSSDRTTCHSELRDRACTAGELRFDTPLRVLDLVALWDAHPSHAEALEPLAYSALLSAKQPDSGFQRPHYVFSRFVADCARDAAIQAIKYPSTRITAGNYNLVILDPEVRLEEVAVLEQWVRLPQKDADNERRKP